MAFGILDEPSIKQWLEQRYNTHRGLTETEILEDSERWLEERKAFPTYTSSNPHSCKHCNTIVIDLQTHKSGNTTKLPYDLHSAISAAREDCVLYQVFIDAVWKGLRRESNEDWSVIRTGAQSPSFRIKYAPEELPQDFAQLRPVVDVPQADGSTKPIGDVDNNLTIWALQGDPASADILVRPYERDYWSSTSTSWARKCIELCRLNHRECIGSVENLERKETISPHSIPSRLLKLYRVEGQNSSYVRIIGRDMECQIPTDEVSNKGFAVLSYCWGGPQPIQLTRNSIKDSSIYSTAVLPKTIADAVWYSLEIGLEYLWVDALCIVQDDANDKSYEIVRMGQYYGDATVTICAASADAVGKGFLPDVPLVEDPKDYVVGPIALRARTSGGDELGMIQVFQEPYYFNSHREREPIAKRGWTLQESLLSRRLIIFSSRHLYFTCREANSSCGGREPFPKSRITGGFESRVPGISTITSLQLMYPIAGTWDKVVDEYTRRNLGFFGDKLPAISAMAASLVRMATEERGHNVRYCAGLILDITGKEWGWRGELLWAVTSPALPLGAADDCASFAPSWSWASLRAPVRRWWHVTPDHFPEQDGIRLLEIEAPLVDERNIFGAVRGGFLRLTSRMRLLSTVDNTEAKTVVTRDIIIADEVYVDLSRPFLILRPDTVDVDEAIARGGRNVFLLEIATPRTVGGERYSGGLMLMKPGIGGLNGSDHDYEDDRYRRVGIFEFQIKVKQGLVNQQMAELEKVAHRHVLFEGCELQEVCIV